MDDRNLLALVERWCAESGHSSAELARRAQMFPGSLSAVLTGRRKLDRFRGERLAAVLGVPGDLVMAGIPRTTRSRPRCRRPGPPWRSSVDDALAARGWTIRGFADVAGLSHGVMFDVLRGHCSLSPLVVQALDKHLELDPRRILTAAGIAVFDGVCGTLTVQRWRCGWSKTELAQKSGTSIATVTRVESGVLPE